MRNLFLTLLMVGCAQGADIDPEVVTPALGSEAIVETSEPYDMTFVPDPELQEATAYGVERWSIATGRDVEIAEEGIPLYAYDHLFSTNEPDREICGKATWSEDGAEVIQIEISLACDIYDAVTHEVGHALAQIKRHSLTGVMASGMNKDRTGIIDANSLELVCYTFTCTEFNPE